MNRKKKEMETKITITGIDKRVKVFTKDGEKKRVERMVRDSMVSLAAFATYGNSTNGVGEEKAIRREKRRRELKPVIETKSMKRSGMAHQVPTPVNDARGLYRACNWIREATLKRAKKRGVNLGEARRMELRVLYEERSSISNVQAGSHTQRFTSLPLQMRDRTHRAAKANRVFASGR